MKFNRKNIRAKPNSNYNTRSFGTKFKVRELDDGGHEISGYAIVFNEPSEDMGFIEYITPSALDKVDFKQLLLLYGHDFNNILARADSGTLTTKVDDKGLFFDAKIPDTTLGNDVYTNIANGNIKGASFRFDIADNGDEWSTDENDQLIHTVTQISNLPEISLTPYPAYTETSVQIERSKQFFLQKRENKMPKELKNKNKVRDVTDTTQAPTSDDNETEVELSPESIQAIASVVVNMLKTDNTNDASDDDKKDPAVDPDDGTADSTTADTDNPDDDDDKKRDRTAKGTYIRQKKGSTPVISITKSETEKQAIRSFGEYVKSHGSLRDNSLTVDYEGNILVPKAVMDAYQQPNDDDKLSSVVNKVAVNEASGSLPIIKKGQARFTTKAELAKNPDLQKMEIDSVEYKLETYAGAIPISNEMLSDYPKIGNIVASYMQTMRALTEQDNIGKILQMATPSIANDADGIKTAVNLGLSNYSKMWILTESGYNFVDQLKDKQGRYLFNDSLTSPSGKSLSGYNVIVVPDKVLGNENEAHAFIGDPRAFVLEPYKDESFVRWMDNDIYGQKLAAYIRCDFKKADGDAGKFLTFGVDPAKAPSASK
ncbi:phage major capsid protein [Lactobacillus sp. M0390]|uniref:phage major capsid protein n=1 Tax=Lactobacillus sp. M0390 TaxID=2751026 RepID=UPI0018DB3DD1|nr:phage major capsid protein [Lactobacillus sp. M0390]MBH9986611.1 phage major capsid protein [Lactobacillus sp. M0390]